MYILNYINKNKLPIKIFASDPSLIMWPTQYEATQYEATQSEQAIKHHWQI